MIFVIGVDIGTQGTKAALFDIKGRCLASAFQASRLRRPKKGVVEENPEEQVDAVCTALSECVRISRVGKERIAAIAIDGQMAGVIGIGANGRAVTPYDSWLDTRCAPFVRIMQKKAGSEIIRKTGGPAGFNHGPKILWWREERPPVYRRVRSFVQPGAYAAMRLCGLDAADAFIDTTYLHFSGFADNRRSRWDETLCEKFDIELEKLPRIVKPNQVTGEVSAAMAPRCGLRRGTLVAAGCGDTAASFLASGATHEGICVDVAGTASVFAATVRQFRPDAKNGVLSCGQSALPGLWHPYAYVNGGGMNLEWFRKNICPGASLSLLDKEAAGLSSSIEDPLFLPHLGGRVTQPGLRGAWAGLDWAHRKAHLYRSLLEGVALEYGLYTDIVRSLYPGFKVSEVRVTGGGGPSRIWNRIKSGVLGCPVVRMKRDEGAPLGAALLAAYAAGQIGDLDAAAQSWTRRGETVFARPRDIALSRKRLERYRRLLDNLTTWTSL